MLDVMLKQNLHGFKSWRGPNVMYDEKYAWNINYRYRRCCYNFDNVLQQGYFKVRHRCEEAGFLPEVTSAYKTKYK